MELLVNKALDCFERRVINLLRAPCVNDDEGTQSRLLCVKIQRLEKIDPFIVQRDIRAGKADPRTRIAELKRLLRAPCDAFGVDGFRTDPDERVRMLLDGSQAAGTDILPILARVDQLLPSSSAPVIIRHINGSATPEWARTWVEKLPSVFERGLRSSITTLETLLETAPIYDRVVAVELLTALEVQECMDEVVQDCLDRLVPRVAQMLEIMVSYGLQDEALVRRNYEDGVNEALPELDGPERERWQIYYVGHVKVDDCIQRTALLLAKVSGDIADACLDTSFQHMFRTQDTSRDYLAQLFLAVCAAGHSVGPEWASIIKGNIRAEEEEGVECPDCISDYKVCLMEDICHSPSDLTAHAGPHVLCSIGSRHRASNEANHILPKLPNLACCSSFLCPTAGWCRSIWSVQWTSWSGSWMRRRERSMKAGTRRWKGADGEEEDGGDDGVVDEGDDEGEGGRGGEVQE